MSEQKRLQKEYDPEFREQAANLVLIEKMSVSAAAKDLGIPVNSLHTWVHKFRQGIWTFKGTASSDRSGSALADKASAKLKLPSSSQKQHDRLNDLESKNRDLETKLRRMTMERDVLKKAMAYCLDVPK
jgi:transposase-like protein